MGKPGSFVALNNVVSQSIPHLHVHVVPRKPKDGLRGFFWPRTKYSSEEEMRSVAEQVRRAVGRAS
jgi:histidine triad (HIT) family protein